MLILIDGKLLDIDDELLTEKLVITKRKYTDQHPEIIHSTNAPIRNKVLDIVNNNGGIISKTAIEKIGINKKWLSNNQHILDKKETNDGTFYKMTKRASNILNKMNR